MLATIFAQNHPIWTTWGIGELAIAVVVVCAILGILFVALRKFGVAIPDWVWHVIGIVFCALICIAAIRFIMGL